MILPKIVKNLGFILIVTLNKKKYKINVKIISYLNVIKYSDEEVYCYDRSFNETNTSKFTIQPLRIQDN